MSSSRRQFVLQASVLPVAGLLGARAAHAADLPLEDEKDPQAVALGYVSDASRADKAKYPKYAPGQACANCQLFQGAATSPAGPCPLYAGHAVAAKGWCSAYTKKA